MIRFAVLLFAFAMSATQGHAQLRWSAAGRVTVGAQHVHLSGTEEQQNGAWYGGLVQARIKAVAIEISGSTGALRADPIAAVPEQQVRHTSLALLFHPREWVAFGPVAEVRRYNTTLGDRVWRMLGASATVQRDIAFTNTTGLVTLSVLPVTSLSSGEQAKLALRAEAGLSVAIPGGMRAMLTQAVERFDFSTTPLGVTRLQQQRTTTLQLSWTSKAR